MMLGLFTKYLTTMLLFQAIASDSFTISWRGVPGVNDDFYGKMMANKPLAIVITINKRE